jgi:hypothetical protein
VVAHFPNRDTIYDAIAAHRHDQTGTLAIEYMSNIPEDWHCLLQSQKVAAENTTIPI